MRQIKIKKINNDFDEWTDINGRKTFSWKFSKSMPQIRVDRHYPLNVMYNSSALKISDKLVYSFMFNNRFSDTIACLYSNMTIADRLNISHPTVKRSLDKLVRLDLLGKVTTKMNGNICFQYFIQPPQVWCIEEFDDGQEMVDKFGE